MNSIDFNNLPNGDIVKSGIEDLATGKETIESLLVSIGAPRLRRGGIEILNPFDDPEDRLYQLLACDHADAAHSRYNAFVRNLVSFERALSCVNE